MSGNGGARGTVIGGVGMIPFRKPGQSESYDLMGAAAVRAALRDANLAYGDVQTAFAGYVYGDSCSGQAALYHVGITGIPIANVNNNCASGSTAFSLAVQAVGSGAADCALAVGFEEMAPGAIDMVFPQKTSPLARFDDTLADFMGLTPAELEVPPAVRYFGCQIELLEKRLGVDEATEALVAVKARRHAAENPNAIFRTPLSVEEVLAQPKIFRGLRKLYACPPSCGAAAVVVCSETFARRRGVDAAVVLVGQGWMSDRAEYFTGDPLDFMFRALSRDAANAAYEAAGIGPRDVDVIELHDCFTSNELLTYLALGLCTEDELTGFVRDGGNTYGGRCVVNPSGGLLSKGHPLGATGLAQITELVQQLRGAAGVRQVPGARTALQHNGGLGSAGFVHILQRRH